MSSPRNLLPLLGAIAFWALLSGMEAVAIATVLAAAVSFLPSRGAQCE